MLDHTAQLMNILRLVSIESSQTFTFAGKTVEAASLPLDDGMLPLVQQLQYRLYAGCYARQDGNGGEGVEMAGRDLTAVLSQANSGCEQWHKGWHIAEILETGQFVVAKGKLRRTLWPGEFVTLNGSGAVARTGDEVIIYQAREAKERQAGYYFAFGDTPSEPTSTVEVVRYYFHVHEAGAPQLVHYLTRCLNQFQVPFRLKCARYANMFERVDTAVLYVQQRYYRIVAELLAIEWHDLRTLCQPNTPLFTKPLTMGLAFAEEPFTSESFGMSRCRLIAEGLWQAFTENQDSVEQKYAYVQEKFSAYGLDWQKPYLRAYSVDYYEFPEFGV